MILATFAGWILATAVIVPLFYYGLAWLLTVPAEQFRVWRYHRTPHAYGPSERPVLTREGVAYSRATGLSDDEIARFGLIPGVHAAAS
jgi:hypothetical protein